MMLNRRRKRMLRLRISLRLDKRLRALDGRHIVMGNGSGSQFAS